MRKALPWLVAAVFAGIFVFQARTPDSTVAAAPHVTLPPDLAGCASEEVFYCQDEQCGVQVPASRLEDLTKCPRCGGALASVSLGERTVLPADTEIVKRLYRTPYGAEFLVSVVKGGVSKSSIHRPELCLPAQGFEMSDPHTIRAGERDFRVIALRSARTAPAAIAYTFFNQEGVRTASHVKRIFTDTWDRSLHNRVDRWVMVSVHASSSAGSPARTPAFERFLSALSRSLP